MTVIGKIDLSRFERSKDPFGNLAQKMEKLSFLLNEEINKKYGFNELINPDGSISIKAFSKDRAGIYRQEEIADDLLKIQNTEFDFINITNRYVRDTYKKYGCNTDKEILAKWKENKAKQKSGRTETIVTILLNRLMGERFIVVKSSTYDDYYSGVDHLIIDKTNGNVVGAFDEVAQNDKHEGSANSSKKQDKVKKINQKGGASIKYGLKINQDKLEMTKLENLPIFYLSLSDENYNKLGKTTDNDIKGEITDTEQKIFDDLITSLKSQISETLKTPNLNNTLVRNIKQFEESLNSFN